MNRELLQQALDALELQKPHLWCVGEYEHWKRTASPTIDAIRALRIEGETP